MYILQSQKRIKTTRFYLTKVVWQRSRKGSVTMI